MNMLKKYALGIILIGLTAILVTISCKTSTEKGAAARQKATALLPPPTH